MQFSMNLIIVGKEGLMKFYTEISSNLLAVQVPTYTEVYWGENYRYAFQCSLFNQ